MIAFLEATRKTGPVCFQNWKKILMYALPRFHLEYRLRIWPDLKWFMFSKQDRLQLPIVKERAHGLGFLCCFSVSFNGWFQVIVHQLLLLICSVWCVTAAVSEVRNQNSGASGKSLDCEHLSRAAQTLPASQGWGWGVRDGFCINFKFSFFHSSNFRKEAFNFMDKWNKGNFKSALLNAYGFFML